MIAEEVIVIERSDEQSAGSIQTPKDEDDDDLMGSSKFNCPTENGFFPADPRTYCIAFWLIQRDIPSISCIGQYNEQMIRARRITSVAWTAWATLWYK